jgi:2-hydroxychromene-2-carboxylate isomerase
MPQIEFFFDLSSPWTRLAFENIQPIAQETGATVLWRPFLVGGVFNAVNEAVYQVRADMSSPRYRNSWVWLKEWTNLTGVPMNFPSKFHPLKSVAAMRCCCVLEDQQADLFRFAGAAFEAYFGAQRNLDDPDVLISIADSAGFDGRSLVAQSQQEAIKGRLRANTDEAIERGAFGSPTLFLERSRMYFGNDQLPLVRQALLEG